MIYLSFCSIYEGIVCNILIKIKEKPVRSSSCSSRESTTDRTNLEKAVVNIINIRSFKLIGEVRRQRKNKNPHQ